MSNSDIHGKASRQDLVVLPHRIVRWATSLWFLSLLTNLCAVIALVWIIFNHVTDPDIHHNEMENKQRQINENRSRIEQLESPDDED